MYQRIKNGFLSGNQLKIIALIAMTIDHVGAYLLKDIHFLRIIGRIAFPIFAYMIAEGCKYTRNKVRFICVLGISALVIQVAGFVATGTLQQTVLVTFLISVALCFALDGLLKKRDFISFLVFVLGLSLVYVITVILPDVLKEQKFRVDYGLFGVLFPVAVFAVERKRDKLIAATLMCIMLSNVYAPVQWYGLIAVPLLALYDGTRGNRKMKYFYYVYFPAHLILIWCVGLYIF